MNGCNNDVTFRQVLQRIEIDAAKGRPQEAVDVIVANCRELIISNGYDLSDALEQDFVNRLACLIEQPGLNGVPGIVLPKISSEALRTELGALLSACKPTDPASKFDGNGHITTVPATEGPQNPSAPRPAEPASSEVIYQGKWLTVRREPDINGFDYTISGELPVFLGITPMELYGVLIRDKRPDLSALRFESPEAARAMLEKIEAQYDYLTHVPSRELRQTSLTEAQLPACEGLVARLGPFGREHPDFIREATDLYMLVYGNELIRIGMQQLVKLMIEERGEEVSKKRPQRWRWAVNTIGDAYGCHIGDYNSLGKAVKNMYVGEVTRLRLESLKQKVGRNTTRQIISNLRPVLKFAKDKGFIRDNPAESLKIPRLRAELEAEAAEDIAIDTPAQVQIALNVAAVYRDGYFLPHVVLLYFAFLRPESELLWIRPQEIQLKSRVIRFLARKTSSRSLIHLTENAAAILEWCWDGGPLKFDGWEEFLEIMRAAQARAAVSPSWFAKQLPVSSTFRKGDIADLPALATMLSRRSLPFYKFLHQELGPKINELLAEYCATGARAQELESLLFDKLNALVQGPSLAENPAFDHIPFRPETVELQTAAPQGADLRRMNRLMCEDACAHLEQTVREVSDRPRHTGKSIYVWFTEWMKETYLDPEKFKVLQTHYNGLIPKQRAALYLSLLPESMPENEKTTAKEKILKQLIKFNFVEDGKLPEAPAVPAFNVQKPVKVLWLPAIPDGELEKLMFDVGMRTAAKQLGTTYNWLSAVCTAKGMRIPPSGRYRPRNPEDVPVPPPLVTLSNKDLEIKLRQLHGITATALELGVSPLALKAYCYIINKVATPSGRELGSWRGKLSRVKLSPHQVKVLIAQGKTLKEIAVIAGNGVTEDHLRRYCAKRGIKIPSEPGHAQAKTDLAAIKAAVGRDLANLDRDKLTLVDALDLVLSHAPEGLSEADIMAALQINGIPFTPEKIRTAIYSETKGLFAHFEGVVHLLKRETPVDLNKLKAELSPVIQGKTGWGPLEAIRCLLGRAQQGLSIQQLTTGLSWFSIQITEDRLIKDVRNYVKQVRLQLYRGVVTLPETAPSFTIGGPEKEPTPNLAALEKAICEKYADLVDKKLTNVEIMEFVLSQAPNGLWVDEFLAITKMLGIHFKESCIHSVVSHEAKGCFQRNNGRIAFVRSGAPRVTWQDLRQAIDGKIHYDGNSSPTDPMVDILACFPTGLIIREWHAIACRVGLSGRYRPFWARAYYLAAKGRCSIKNGRAIIPSAPTAAPKEDTSGPERPMTVRGSVTQPLRAVRNAAAASVDSREL